MRHDAENDSAGDETTAQGEDPAEVMGPDAALVQRFPWLVCDLDGVVYRGAEAVSYAVPSLTAATDTGAQVVFATNNASRPPEDVVAALRGFGLTVQDTDVVTSAMAGAHELASRLSAGARVLAIGGDGVSAALRAVGLHPVSPAKVAGTGVDAVLQGYGRAVTAADLGEVAYAVQSGAAWVATNDDRTLPTDRGVAPGNGSLVAAVRLAVDVDPVVVGKPGPLLYRLAARTLASDVSRTLGIGDRLETDVAGAHAAGMSALHVLTGVHGPADLVRADPGVRPRFVAEDLRSLTRPYREPRRLPDGRWITGDVVAVGGGRAENFRMRFTAPSRQEPVAWIEQLRLALRVLWDAIDAEVLTLDQAVAALPPKP